MRPRSESMRYGVRWWSVVVMLIAGVAFVAAETVAEPTAFRAIDLDLRDPHAFTELPLFGCTDITDTVPFGLAESVNEQLETALLTDSDGDGLLDLSPLIVFDPLDPSASGGVLLLHFGSCTTPVEATVCDRDPENPLQFAAYSNSNSGTCLEPFPGTTSGYLPPIATPAPPCFVTEPFLATISLVGVEVQLEATQVAATYVGNPATTLASGLISGFLSEAAADQVILAPELPFIGGQPLSSVLPGGSGNCAAGDDRDLGPDGQTLGWWFYLNFEAVVVPYSGTTSVTLAESPAATLRLEPARPNPFNPSTALSYALPSTQRVRLSIFDLAGRPVATLVDGVEDAGPHTVTWDGRTDGGRVVASGVYFSRLEAGSEVMTRKLVLAR